jgi:hypothetical protein
MPTGHTPRLKRKRILRQSVGSLRPTKTSCVEPSELQDKSLGNDTHSAGTSNPVSRPSTPSGATVSASSSRASTPLENTELQATAHQHTSISVFPQGNRHGMSVKRAVSRYRSTSELPVETDVTDRDEDYEDVPNEDVPWVDKALEPEEPPAKRSRTTDKATAVSPWTVTSVTTDCTDYILKRKKPLEDFIHIRDTLLLELCRHEGLRGLATESSGFPLCGDCGESSGTLRCTECAINAVICPHCMCARHLEQPLHRIQVRMLLLCVSSHH